METPLGKMMKAISWRVNRARTCVSWHPQCLPHVISAALPSDSVSINGHAQAWCGHHRLPLNEASFLLGKRALKSEDGSLDGAGCTMVSCQHGLQAVLKP